MKNNVPDQLHLHDNPTATIDFIAFVKTLEREIQSIFSISPVQQGGQRIGWKDAEGRAVFDTFRRPPIHCHGNALAESAKIFEIFGKRA